MVGKRIRNWLKKWHSASSALTADPVVEQNLEVKYEFSPMTYENPCICCMNQIVEQVLEKRNMLYQHMKLVFIDGEMERDDYDIQIVLSQLSNMLNYLMVVTDRPLFYKDFIDTMFEENGLIVQQVSKTTYKDIGGNMILDFERSEKVSFELMSLPGVIYIPIYKKPWEICENLDIIVPVGYNTLVVNGIVLPISNDSYSVQEGLFENKLDRLDQEFRKG